MPRKRGVSVDIAFDKIRSMIEHYELSPMDIVSEIELSRQLDMSRTPVREAIYKLMEYGLVVQHNSKLVVAAITMQDIIEIYQAREAAELMAARIIINNGGFTQEQKKIISEIEAELEFNIAADEQNNIFRTNADFHNKLVFFSANKRLMNFVEKLQVQSERLCWLGRIVKREEDLTSIQHNNIIQAIEELDIPRAEEAIRLHIKLSLENYEQLLNEGTWTKILKTVNSLKNGNP